MDLVSAQGALSQVSRATQTSDSMLTREEKYVSLLFGTVDTNVGVFFNVHFVCKLFGLFVRAYVCDGVSDFENSPVA